VKPLKEAARRDEQTSNPREEVSVKDAHARLNEYARLLSELNEHYDGDLDRVVVFRYSDELIRAMNEHEVYSPDDAWLVFAEVIDELLNELALVGAK
jgi:hypothetical protein